MTTPTIAFVVPIIAPGVTWKGKAQNDAPTRMNNQHLHNGNYFAVSHSRLSAHKSPVPPVANADSNAASTIPTTATTPVSLSAQFAATMKQWTMGALVASTLWASPAVMAPYYMQQHVFQDNNNVMNNMGVASAKEKASGSGSRVNKDPESLLRYGLPIQNKEVSRLHQ